MATDRTTMTFHDSLIPALVGGRYCIQVEHEVDGSSLPTAQQEFDVRAPRFALDPSFVHAAQPAPGSVGPFDNHLAHVTLNRSILPWEQWLKDGEEQWGERIPWLVLLLFRENELPNDPGAQGKTDTSQTVRSLIDPDDPNFDSSVYGPQHIATDSVLPDVLDGICRTIDVPPDVLGGVLPGKDELGHLTHLRYVTEGEDPTLMKVDLEDPGQYSVVVASRFPRSPGNYAAHLVSLEGFWDLVQPHASMPSKNVRLVSLYSWSFTFDDKGKGHFEDVVKNLAAPGLRDIDANKNPDPLDELSLRLPPNAFFSDNSPEGTEACNRLKWGYVPLPYMTASGDETFSWFRGPLTPVPPSAVEGLPPVGKVGNLQPTPSPDGLLVYVPKWGMFDLSYAAAWSMGRLLALSHAPARSAQKALWQKARRTAVTVLERLATPSRVSGLAPEALTTAEALASPRPAVDHFHTLLADGAADRHLTKAPAGAGPTPPTAPPATGRRMPMSRADQLRVALERSEVREMLATALADTADALADVEEALYSLKLVSFDHLVPDLRMLPPESLRFFYIDPTWLAALEEGFISAGVQSEMDQTLREPVAAAVAARLSAKDVQPPKAGMLLHSRLAHDWPGLVMDFEADGQPVQIVRRENLAPGLLLCLFDQVPRTVTFYEPHQSLYLGATPDGKGMRLDLRYLKDSSPTAHPTGAPIMNSEGDAAEQFPQEPGPDGLGLLNYLRTPPAPPVTAPYSAAQETLDIRRLLPDLTARLTGLGQQLDPPYPDWPVTPGGFAIQLIKSPTFQVFDRPS